MIIYLVVKCHDVCNLLSNGIQKKNKYMCSIKITCVNIGEKANTANVINDGGYMGIQRSFSTFL